VPLFGCVLECSCLACAAVAAVAAHLHGCTSALGGSGSGGGARPRDRGS